MNIIVKLIVSFATALLSQISMAAPSNVLANPIAFATLEEAGIAAVRLSASYSQNIEYGGCLYQSGGLFFYTTPATDGKGSDFSATCMIDPRSLVGIFHTHPANPDVGVSALDISVAKQFKVVSYIGFLEGRDAKIVKFVPGVTRVVCQSGSSNSCSHANQFSDGDFVAPL